jgi:hypothetical protein
MARNKRLRGLPDDLADWTIGQLQAELVRCQTKARFFGHIGQARNLKETLKRVRRIEKALAEQRERRQ